MTSVLLACALASLPAANPMSLPEGIAPAPLLPALTAPATAPAMDPASAQPSPSPLAPASMPPMPNFGSSAPSPWGLAGAALLVLALGAATFWSQRRRRHSTRHIQVLETAPLGPKRSLALVVVGRQSLLLSCCDAGIFLVSAQTATPEMLQSADQASAGIAASDMPIPLLRPLETPRSPSGFGGSSNGGFAVQLAEAEETQGLRRRLNEAGVLR